MSAKTDSANLDFLRAAAVVAVYLGHAFQIFHVERIFGQAAIYYEFAHTGVLIFFVHTSLVLMLSMERMAIPSWWLYPLFYIRRAFRIYPLSIVTVLAMLAAHAPDFPTDPYRWPGYIAVASNLTLTQNLTQRPSYPAVLWSLPFELQMYAVLPVLFFLFRRFPAWWIPLALWAADAAAILLMWRAGLHRIPFLLQFTPCFLGGLIGYRLWRAPRLQLPFWGWPVAILSCVAVESASVPQAPTLASWLACLFLGLAVPQFRELGPGWLRTLASAGARYSYGIYLSHTAVFWIAFVVLKQHPFWMQLGACAALSVLFPLAMYHAIEQPMIRAGVRVFNRVKAYGSVG